MANASGVHRPRLRSDDRPRRLRLQVAFCHHFLLRLHLFAVLARMTRTGRLPDWRSSLSAAERSDSDKEPFACAAVIISACCESSSRVAVFPITVGLLFLSFLVLSSTIWSIANTGMFLRMVRLLWLSPSLSVWRTSTRSLGRMNPPAVVSAAMSTATP